MFVARSDRIHDLDHFPLFSGIDRGALVEFPVLVIEAALARSRAKKREIGSSARRGGRRRGELGPLADGPMAIHAIDLDRIARFSVDVAVAVAILLKVAVR